MPMALCQTLKLDQLRMEDRQIFYTCNLKQTQIKHDIENITVKTLSCF